MYSTESVVMLRELLEIFFIPFSTAPQVEDLDEVTKGTVNAISEVLREEGLRTSPAKDGNDTETSLRYVELLPLLALV